MARRQQKLVRLRAPGIHATPSGTRVSMPSARIGGRRTGVNVSSRGVSVSTGGKWWSFNSRRGCTLKMPGCLIPILMLAGALILVLAR